MTRPVPRKEWFETAISKLYQTLPQPRAVGHEGNTVYRFENPSILHAIFLKSVRYVSGLNAGQTLFDLGFFQELGTLQRTLDEFQEDVLFLSLAVHSDDITKMHNSYLDAFWQEERDFPEFRRDQRNRYSVPRKKVHAYISRMSNGGRQDAEGEALGKYLSSENFGFVHGAASHILDLYDPKLDRFDVQGVSDPDLRLDHERDWQNYHFRGLIVIAFAAKSLGAQELLADATEIHARLTPHYVK
jgi:hypothetical protein